MPQLEPSQVAVPPEAAHGVQLTPQFIVEDLSTHMPLQLCWPLGQTPLQGAAASVHLSTQTCWPLGQLGTHFSPSQPMLPPCGALGHLLPQPAQLSTSFLSMQAPLHKLNPSAQTPPSIIAPSGPVFGK